MFPRITRKSHSAIVIIDTETILYPREFEAHPALI